MLLNGIKTKVTIKLIEGGDFDFDSDSTTITDPGGVGFGPGGLQAVLITNPIPTLSQWMLISLTLLLGWFGYIRLHRKV